MTSSQTNPKRWGVQSVVENSDPGLEQFVLHAASKRYKIGIAPISHQSHSPAQALLFGSINHVKYDIL